MADGKPTQGERLTSLERSVATLSERIGGVLARMDKQDGLIVSVNKLAMSIEVMAEKLANTNGKIEDVVNKQSATEKKVECLMLAPAKKWDTLSLGIISMLVSAILGVIVGKFF